MSPGTARGNAVPSPHCVLITGATGGIGTALALEYAAVGRTLLLHGRNPDRLADLASRCTQRGATVAQIAIDLADAREAAGRLRESCGEYPIELAIVNAGVSHISGANGESWEDIERVLQVNLNAAIATVSAVVPGMRERGRGQIALMSSLAAYFGLPLTPAYCASKAALKAYGESLRGGLASQGVAVNVVLPGFVNTAMSDRFPSAKPFMILPDRAARRIRHGLERNRARIAFPIPMSWGAWWLSVLPSEISEKLVQLGGYGVRRGK